MSTLEFHVLLALAGGPLYGYAIKDAVAAESGGTHTPRAGSLYRVLARLMTAGLVKETDPRGGITAHPRPQPPLLRAHRRRPEGAVRRGPTPQTHGGRGRTASRRRARPVVRNPVRRLLVGLIRLFPPAFRAQFGADMAEQVGRDYDLARARGPASALWYALGTTFDLVRSATAERWNPAFARVVPATPLREKDPMGSIAEWARDLRLAFRTLRRSPGFAAVTIGPLGLAIGATAGMWSVVDRVILRPLPYPDPGRLMAVDGTAPGTDLPARFGLGREFYLQYREQSKLAADVALFGGQLRQIGRAHV